MSETKQNTPLIGISIGDINGVGPEIILKTFSDQRIFALCTPIIYGSGKVIAYYRKVLNININYNQCDSIESIKHNTVNIINCIDNNIEVKPGELLEAAGKASFEALEKATTDLVSRKIDALVTAPINKKLIQNKDFDFPGHTEYLTKRAEEKTSLMLMTSSNLKVGLVTGHIPISAVSNAITKEAIISKATLLHRTLKKDFGITKPKIAILGLNPHAGDNGLLGKEEIDIIIPSIKELKEKEILAFGPYPADGFFGNFSFKAYDGVLAMYHDQGLTPFKTIAFEKGVNYTASLPIIRTSPDHGTGYEIAGKGIANETSFREAVYLAIDIHIKRKEVLA